MFPADVPAVYPSATRMVKYSTVPVAMPAGMVVTAVYVCQKESQPEQTAAQAV